MFEHLTSFDAAELARQHWELRGFPENPFPVDSVLFDVYWEVFQAAGLDLPSTG